MDLKTLEKAIELNDKLVRERSTMDEINRLKSLNDSKNLSSTDIKYLVDKAYEGADYIIRDLRKQFEELK